VIQDAKQLERNSDVARPATPPPLGAGRDRTDRTTRWAVPTLDPVHRTALVAALGLLATLLVGTVPSVRFAYANVSARLVTETANGLIAGLTSVLLLGRFRRSGAGRDLVLAHSMGLLAAASLVLVTVPGVLGDGRGGALTTWAPLLTRLVAAVMIAVAAATPGWRVHRTVHPLREAAVGAGLLLLLAVAVQLASARLPAVVVVAASPTSSALPRLEPHPVFLAAQLVNLACYAIAAAAFTVQGKRRGDDFVSWIGAACAMGACARLNYALFPSIYSGWFYFGDALRVAYFLLLLTACVRELQAYWASQVAVAAEAERRRLARDLHDGAVQELGYLRSQVLRVEDHELRGRMLGAAERALDETRRALFALTSEAGESTEEAVRRAVCEVGDRYDVRVSLYASDPGVGPDQTEALVRIAREAVSNGARHGSARSVALTLGPGRLVIEDDGTGFDVGRARGGRGFGLVSMRDRAEGLGGRLEVRSAPGAGTRVEVTW
jgi:signal transduction histidine kinase